MGGRYLRIERGVIEFDKRLLIARYLESDPPSWDEEAFCLVDASLAGQDLSEGEVQRLREAVRRLRLQTMTFLEA